MSKLRTLPGAVDRALEKPTRFLGSRLALLLFGCLTALEIAFIWGSLNPVPVVHDEAAYLLQAKIFATGHWTAPGRPLPQFFEQFHVLVTPVFAGKYPPGHPLLLVPGIWLGLPGLVPVVLAGIAGSLVFLLARRLANSWVALLTWIVWTTAPGNLRFSPSYLAQTATVVLWLAGWWAIAHWLETKRPAWLVLLSVCVAWGVLARPFTMAGYAVVAGFVVGREIFRHRAWRDLTPALVPAMCILAVIPLWDARTTGNVWTTPYALYSRIYFPYQRPGFGLPAASDSQRSLPPDMARYAEWYRGLHAAHTWKAVPRELFDRLRGIFEDTWGGVRRPLALLAILGLFFLPREGIFALATGATLVLTHIPFAHPWPWSVYYLELQPSLAFLTALGLWALFSATVTSRTRPARPSRRLLATTVSAGGALAALILALAFAVPGVSAVTRARRERERDSSYHRVFQTLLSSIPERRALVFVRYKPDHDPHRSLIANEPDLAGARAWIVYDRGAENARLMGLAPVRAPYVFDEAAGALTRLPAAPFQATPYLRKTLRRIRSEA